MEQNIIKNSNKIVIKIGSSTITSEDGVINTEFLDRLAMQVKALVRYRETGGDHLFRC